MFNCTPVERLAQNYLVIGVAPNEGIALQFNTKVPGPSILIDGVEMKFRYKDYFKAEPSTGYETLIYDCMIGDNILFQRADSVEAGWKAVQPFIDAWKKAGAEGLKTYKAGSEGPEEANELLRARRPKLAKARVNDGRERQPPRDHGRRSSGAGGDRRRTCAGQNRRQQRPRGDLPDRRIEPEAALSIACDRGLSKPDPVAARALVHRRRTLRAGGRPAQQHGHGASGFPGPMRAGGKHPSDSDRDRRPCRSRPRRRALRTGTAVVLRRRHARSTPGPCSISC